MASRTVPVFGQFHQKCGVLVVMSEGRRVASSFVGPLSIPGGSIFDPLPIAFSNDPIPNGVQFSVKVLQQGKGNVFRFGVTTKDPDSGPVPQEWDVIDSSDQYWTVYIESDGCRAKHKRQARKLQWALDRSEGNTFGCHVSGTGELHLHHNGRDVGVAWEGLSTDQPLWGFLVLRLYKVEANYVIAQSHPQGPSGSDQTSVGARSTGHPQDYAGKTFHFVKRPPEWLVCAVCQALAHDPVQANCCGNIYCSRCIERWKTRSNSCPTCRSTEQSKRPFSVFEDRRAYRDVRNLLVHCPNICGKKMELSAVENHLTSDNGCPDQVVECGNKCGHKERRATVKKHMTTKCRLRQEKCKYCLLVSTHEQVTGDHLKLCPNYPLDCPNKCGTRDVTRSTVPAHREVCPMQRVECEYKRFGCAIVLPRKDMAEHLKTSVEAHLQMTKRRVEEMEGKAERERQRVNKMEERAERERQEMKEKAYRMNDVIARLMDRVEQLELKK